MAEEKKQGFWSKLFAPKGGCCGELKIEEVAGESADRDAQPGEAGGVEPSPAPTGKPRMQRKPCCGGDTGSGSGGCCG